MEEGLRIAASGGLCTSPLQRELTLSSPVRIAFLSVLFMCSCMLTSDLIIKNHLSSKKANLYAAN